MHLAEFRGDERSRRHDIFVFVVLLTIVLISKWKTLGLPYYWDETIWVQGAYWLSEVNLLRVIPGFHPNPVFDYHPPILHFSAAALFKVMAPSAQVCHLLIVLISFLGVYYTYLLGSFLYGRTAGIFGALFLFLSPIYFAQSGMFLGDLPVAAFGVICVYFAFKGRYIPYLLCGIYLVFIKETSMAIIFSILSYFYLTERKASRETFIKILKYGLPLALLFGFFIFQKIMTGRFCHMDARPGGKIQIEQMPNILHGAVSITKWLFLRQERIWFSLLIVLNLALFKTSRWRKEYLIFLLLVCASGYSYVLLQFLPRYLLTILPFFCILAGWSLTRVISSVTLQSVFAGILCFFLIRSLTAGPLIGTSEWDMKYPEVIEVHKQMGARVEKDFAGAQIVTSWPLSRQLELPFLGYVRKSLKVYTVDVAYKKTRVEVGDVFYWSEPPSRDSDFIKEYAVRNQLPIVTQVDKGRVKSTLYIARKIGTK